MRLNGNLGQFLAQITPEFGLGLFEPVIDDEAALEDDIRDVTDYVREVHAIDGSPLSFLWTTRRGSLLDGIERIEMQEHEVLPGATELGREAYALANVIEYDPSFLRTLPDAVKGVISSVEETFYFE